jgi:hypothetical protein
MLFGRVRLLIESGTHLRRSLTYPEGISPLLPDLHFFSELGVLRIQDDYEPGVIVAKIRIFAYRTEVFLYDDLASSTSPETHKN